VVKLRRIGQCYRNYYFLFSERTVTENIFLFLFSSPSFPPCGAVSIRYGWVQLNYGWRFDRRQYPYGRAGCEKALKEHFTGGGMIMH
jgi:hypothetical protein